MTDTVIYGITTDPSRDGLFDAHGLQRLKEGYMKSTETSPQERFAFVCSWFASNPEHAQRLYEYTSKHWLSLSTPILSFGRNSRGLPISCFLNWIPDTSEGLVNTLSETNWLSMLGGGVGIGFGIRSADSKSTGVLPHLKIYDASSLAYRQGETRRGSFAAYLDISHPDIIQFIDLRKPTGDQNMRAPNMHHGINISDEFMQLIEQCMIDSKADDRWALRDPHTNEIRDYVSAKELWQRILETRALTGEPYIHFIDTSNRLMQPFQKALGLKIRQSNLCTEIILPTDEKRTAVCCLGSVNLEYFDEWKDQTDQFLLDTTEMLDNVLSYFIGNAPEHIRRAVYSAINERSIGVGALGFHAYLQKNNIAWESPMAVGINRKIFSTINSSIDKANMKLGAERGEAPDARGTGRRFSNTMAIAPNASSSIIMGNTSPSIEPYRANAIRQDTLSGSYFLKNKYLDKIIKKRVQPTEVQEVWSSVIANDGSVQHLDILSDWEKDVFKTAMEIDQRWIVQHAADRQQYIDQSQSVNLFFRPDANIKYIHAVHFQAWKSGLKTLYYYRSAKIGKADKISKSIERKVIDEIDLQALVEGNDCLACEG